jgi:hypothetical protein
MTADPGEIDHPRRPTNRAHTNVDNRKRQSDHDPRRKTAKTNGATPPRASQNWWVRSFSPVLWRNGFGRTVGSLDWCRRLCGERALWRERVRRELPGNAPDASSNRKSLLGCCLFVCSLRFAFSQGRKRSNYPNEKVRTTNAPSSGGRRSLKKPLSKEKIHAWKGKSHTTWFG